MTPLLTLVILSLTHSLTHSLTSKKYFYIYDWPQKMRNVYPPLTATLHNETTYSHDFNGNDGYGKTISREFGVFATWQFSLFKNIMARLRVSEYRTLDSREATAFIVPYDMGVNSFIDHKNGRLRLASPYGWDVTKLLKREQKRNPHVWKNNGHDHFVLFSLIGARMCGMGTRTFFENTCKNCSGVTIETSPFRISMTASYVKTKKFWTAVPYPSSFHWCEGIKELPWAAPPRATTKRHVFVMFIGSIEMATPRSSHLRRRLYKDCSEHIECQWHQTEHTCKGIQNNETNQSSTLLSPVLLYKQSIFCLSPTGDSFTRKSLFDSYLAGCIPVIFSKLSLNMYEWHLTQEEIDETSIFIPRPKIVDKKANFMDILLSVPKEKILEMQLAIEKMAFKLQYSVVPDEYRESTSDIEVINADRMRKTWRPPNRDANDIIIERFLDTATMEPMTGFPKQTYKALQKAQIAFLGSEWFIVKADRALINSKVKEIIEYSQLNVSK